MLTVLFKKEIENCFLQPSISYIFQKISNILKITVILPTENTAQLLKKIKLTDIKTKIDLLSFLDWTRLCRLTKDLISANTSLKENCLLHSGTQK